MLDLLSIWAESLKASPHLSSFMRERNLTVHIQEGESEAFITFEDGEIWIKNMLDNEADVSISSNEDGVSCLFKGEMKLLQAVKNGFVVANGHLRFLLFLESILWLGTAGLRSKEMSQIK